MKKDKSKIINFNGQNQPTHLKAQQEDPELVRKWQLAFYLQYTMDIPSLIKVFMTHIESEIAFDSMQYVNKALDIDSTFGKAERHFIDYELTLENSNIGLIVITRRTKFTEAEISLFEDRLCTLVYPLLNAVRYYEAIRLSLFDPLTGVANRIGLMPSLHSEIELASRYDHNLSLLVLDIDNFKTVNDNYGHACGDYILTSIASQVDETVRDSDLFYRYGGDEFVVVLRKTDKLGALTLAERVRTAIDSTEYKFKRIPISMTVSIGIATRNEDDTNESLLDRADQALIRAKREGKNLVSL